MAIIKCPECGKEVSDKATSCIFCGYPLFSPENKKPSSKTNNMNTDSSSSSHSNSYSKKKAKSHIGIGCLTITIIFMIGLILFAKFGISGSSRRYPSTYNEAYREYQNGNKAPLENFYKWLEKNP